MSATTNLNILRGQLRRTAPMRVSSQNDLVPTKTPRVNGWTWPPQVFQIIVWLVYNYFAIVAFGMFIPLLPSPWKHVLYAFVGLAFGVHLLSHVAAVTIDPADASVRAKKTYAGPMPLFDRTVQAHVIQDSHCYLCDVKVGPKVKHCSVCNKCVSDFDHHCKWLNNCVGGRNYRFFFVAVSSAAVGVVLLVAVITFIFIQHYVDPNVLRTDPRFHMCKGLSTFDYIKLQRQKEARSRDAEVGSPHGVQISSKVSQNHLSSKDCEPTQIHGSSTCKTDNKGSLSSRLPDSICRELENDDKPPEKDTIFHHDTPNSREKESKSDMITSRSWKPGTGGGDMQSESIRSVESVPDVQNPLGSSVMTPDDT
ncbi:palmitoyltransferase ZDHHC11 isoform X2 [Stigmatopora nigra]